MTLKLGSQEEIVKLMRQLQENIKMLIHEMAEISYYMNGGIQYEDLFYRTPGERQIMNDIIVDALKARSGNIHV